MFQTELVSWMILAIFQFTQSWGESVGENFDMRMRCGWPLSVWVTVVVLAM